MKAVNWFVNMRIVMDFSILEEVVRAGTEDIIKTWQP